MNQVNTYEAKKNLSSLLERVERGETIVIARRNKPIAELKPAQGKKEGPRPAGLCKGEFKVPNDFNAPLPRSVLKAFEGS